MNIKEIKVSVITPTYNCERFVSDTLKSILNQTHPNLEVLVVDDCSTDGTVDIVKSFKDSRIRLFQNNNNYGSAFSRNLALRESTGEYIAFLDGDDIWDVNKLEHQLKFMVENNHLFSCTEYYVIDEDGASTGKYLSAPQKITHRKFLKMDYAGCLTVMYKKSIASDLQIPDNILKRNDYALWLKVSEKEPCYLLKEKLAFYRKRNTSISSGKKTKLLIYHKKMFSSLYAFSRTKSSFFAYRNAFFYFWKIIFYQRKCKK